MQRDGITFRNSLRESSRLVAGLLSMDAVLIANLLGTTVLWFVLNMAVPGMLILSGVGSVQPLLPYPLYHEVVGHPADPAPVPHVQAGVEVQRVISL